MLDAEMRNIDGTNMPPREDETDTIYEYAVSDADLEWVHWRHMVPTWEYPRGEEKPKFAQLVIPTLDRTTWSLTLLPRRHVQGCGRVQRVSLRAAPLVDAWPK
eukprot:1158208-Pelagomonas_calceolata.AAC.21